MPPPAPHSTLSPQRPSPPISSLEPTNVNGHKVICILLTVSFSPRSKNQPPRSGTPRRGARGREIVRESGIPVWVDRERRSEPLAAGAILVKLNLILSHAIFMLGLNYSLFILFNLILLFNIVLSIIF